MCDYQLERYHKLDKVGEGTYGVVYKAMDKQNSRLVAIKNIRLQHQQQGVPSTAIRQISLLKDLEHQNVVGLLDIVHTQSRLSLVFQFVDFDLKKFMQKRGSPLTISQTRRVMFQLLQGVAFCHQNRAIHRDLKPQNILVSNDLHVKIADFGLARTYSLPLRSYTHEVVTLWYRAPQILLGVQRYTTAVDMWSIGCIFYQMLVKKPLFPGDSEIDQLFKIFKVLGTPRESEWPGVSKHKYYKTTFPKWTKGQMSQTLPSLGQEGIDLIQKLLRYDPSKRPSAVQCLSHPFFIDSKKSE